MAVAATNTMAAPHRTWLIRVMCFLSRLVPRRPELLPGGTFFTYSRKRTLPSGQCYWQEVRIGVREPPDVGVGSEAGVTVTDLDESYGLAIVSGPLRPFQLLGRGPRQPRCLICHIATIFGREGGAAPEERYSLISIRSQILGVAIVMRPANLGTATCAAVFATLLALIGPVAAQEATEETTGALPQETSTPPIEEGGAAVDQAAAGSGHSRKSLMHPWLGIMPRSHGCEFGGGDGDEQKVRRLDRFESHLR